MDAKINNLPDYADKYKYIVATLVDGQLWFYGAYDSYDMVEDALKETSGRVIIKNEFNFG